MPFQQLLYVADATFFGGPLSVMLTAVDAQNGMKYWQTTIPGQSGTNEKPSLQFVDGVLYAIYASPGSTFSDTLTALAARDGKIIWQYQRDGQHDEQILKIYVDQNILCLYVICSPSKATIEVYRVKDYQYQWHSTTTRILLTEKCLFTKQIVYKISCPRLSLHPRCTIRALRSSNGKELWHMPLAPTTTQMVATEHMLYIAYELAPPQGPMEVRALSPHDGSLLWKYALKNERNFQNVMVHHRIQNMVVLNNVLYLEDFSCLTALDAHDGRHLWTKKQQYTLGFQTEDRILYAQHNAEELCALDPQSGNTLWCTEIETAGSFTIATENNVYTAANFRGVVHALQKSNGQLLWSYENHLNRRIFGLAVGEVTDNNLVS